MGIINVYKSCPLFARWVNPLKFPYQSNEVEDLSSVHFQQSLTAMLLENLLSYPCVSTIKASELLLPYVSLLQLR